MAHCIRVLHGQVSPSNFSKFPRFVQIIKKYFVILSLIMYFKSTYVYIVISVLIKKFYERVLPYLNDRSGQDIKYNVRSIRVICSKCKPDFTI